MMKLSSDRLEVSVCAPSEVPSQSRFDRAGFITQVVLDGKYGFCAEEPPTKRHPSSGGCGLCSEILCAEADARTPVGGLFPKFGVGLLLKEDDAPYRHYHRYRSDPFTVLYNSQDSRAFFLVEPREAGGMALGEEKLIAVTHNHIDGEYRFTNEGSVPLHLSEYCHNFITLDGLPADQSCRLTIPTIASQLGKASALSAGNLRGAADGFGFEGDWAGEPSMIRIGGEEIDPDRAFSWTLSRADSPLRVSETPDFVPDHLFIWTFNDTVCTEVIKDFTLDPGTSICYRRRWTFSC